MHVQYKSLFHEAKQGMRCVAAGERVWRPHREGDREVSKSAARPV